MKKLVLFGIIFLVLLALPMAFAAPDNTSLVSYWNFDDNTADIANNTNTLNTTAGAYQYQDGRHNDAYASSGGAVWNTSFIFPINPPNNFTLYMWINCTVIDSRQLNWRDTGALNEYVQMYGTQVIFSDFGGTPDSATLTYNSSLGKNWTLVTIVKNSTTCWVYFNATAVAKETNCVTWGNTWNGIFALMGTSPGIDEPSCGIDEAAIYSVPHAEEDIRSVYNDNNPQFYPFGGGAPPAGIPPTPTFVNPTPNDGKSNNTNQTINVTVCDTCNVYLWFDGNATPLTARLNNVSATNWTTQLDSDGTYYYRAAAYNTSNGLISANTSIRTFILDTTTPTIVINPSNSFNASNLSQRNQYGNFIYLNITANDNDNLFAFLVNITRSGTTYFNFTNTSVNTSSFNYTKSIDISSWGAGVYDVEVTASDGHTLSEIGNYDISQLFGKITFSTEEGNEISISSTGAVSTSYIKLKDRYNYGFNYLLSDTERTFTIKSKNKIYYMSGSKYAGHFVIWNEKTKTGNWIDFEGLSKDYSVKKVSDYEYDITFIGLSSSKSVSIKSIGGLNVRTENYKWYRGTYTATAPEASSEESTVIILNMTMDADYISDLNATLIYNHTVATTSKTNYTTYMVFNATITTPSVLADSSINYTWNVTITQPNGGKYNLSISQNQSVLNWGLDNCTLFSTPAINFTIKDEMNSSYVNADITGTFNYSINKIKYRQFSLSLTNRNNFSICIAPTNGTIYSAYTVYYESPSYNYIQRRRYDADSILTNSTISIPLYLLSLADGIYVRFRVVDTYKNPIEGVSVAMKRTIGTSYVTIESTNTDDSGMATLFTNPDETYDFVFTKTGYKSQTNSLRATTSEIYTVTLEKSTAEDISSYSRGISFVFYPIGQVLINNTAYDFVFNLTSSYWGITNCTGWIRFNDTILSEQKGTYTSSKCGISINYNTGNYSTILWEVTYELNGTANITVGPYYGVKYTYTGQFSLKNFFDDISSFAGAGFNDFTRMIIAFIVIFAVLSIVASQGVREPEPLIILFWGLVVVFSYLGWFTVDYATIPTAFLKKYILAVLVSLGGGAFIWMRVTQ